MKGPVNLPQGKAASQTKHAFVIVKLLTSIGYLNSKFFKVIIQFLSIMNCTSEFSNINLASKAKFPNYNQINLF